MSGSLAVPDPDFFHTAGPNPSFTRLDANFSAITTYVNVREVTTGNYAARPSPGIKGRFYLATDTGGGALYVDDGSNWQPVAGGGPGGSVLGTPRVQGFQGSNNSGAPDTVYNVGPSAFVQLRSPSDGSILVRANVAIQQCDITLAGVPGGRDQAGALNPSSWVHFYLIDDGTNIRALCSATALPGGPALPAGYTRWAYAAAVYLDATSHLRRVRANGDLMTYEVAQNILAGGQATAETAVNLTALVPPNALSVYLHYAFDSTGALGATSTLRYIPAQDFMVFRTVAGVASLAGSQVNMPHLNQALAYQNSSAAAAGTRIDIHGYRIPNGDG